MNINVDACFPTLSELLSFSSMHVAIRTEYRCFAAKFI